jgi:hypothetical protein
MRILIVGCGAVGQVYALSLQRAGVELGLYDQPPIVMTLKQAREQGGIPIYQVTARHRRNPIVHWLRDYQVVADLSESQQFKPDQIWFTTPSQVYYSEWFGDFLGKVPSKRVVCFIPEGKRPEFEREKNPNRMVYAGTTFMAWQGDLEGSVGQAEGVHFWLPGLAIPIVGAEDACRELKRLLRSGGFRVTVGRQDSRMQAVITAVMTVFVAGLELCGWSLKEIRRSPWLQRTARASREAVLSQLGEATIFWNARFGSSVIVVALLFVTMLGPMLFPFDFEEYLRFHYQKTRGQTLALLELFIKDGQGRMQPVEYIQGLLQDLRHSS